MWVVYQTWWSDLIIIVVICVVFANVVLRFANIVILLDGMGDEMLWYDTSSFL